MNTGSYALRIQQLAMQVVGQNTANVNTDGFTRRRLDLTTAPPSAGLGVWDAGAGVDVLNLARVRDGVLDRQVRTGNGDLNYWSKKDDVLSQVENVFNEMGDSAIGTQLQDFWASWQDLANHPEGDANRSAVLQKAQTLSAGVRRAYSDLSQRHDNVDSQIKTDVTEVNSLTSKVAQLNVQIVRSEMSGGEASDLRDERDRVLDRLSSLMNISTQEDSNGAVSVFNGGQAIVQLDHNTELTMSTVSSNGLLNTVVTYGTSGRQLELQGGEIKGLMDVRDKDIRSVMDNLDTFAVALANRVNEVHRTGYSGTNITGVDFFASDVTGAASFRVSDAVSDDYSLIATAAAPDSPGDNSIALQLAGIQNEKLLNSGRSTASEFYRDAMLDLGSKKSFATSQLKVEQVAADNLENRRQQVSGVSLDEEMTRLVQVQQAYGAAAKIVNAVDQMMQTVLTLGTAA
jgi:flagellar hook-associated protein 1 FlgK